MGGIVTKQDAMVVGVPASVLHKEEALVIEKSGTLRKQQSPKPLLPTP